MPLSPILESYQNFIDTKEIESPNVIDSTRSFVEPDTQINILAQASEKLNCSTHLHDEGEISNTSENKKLVILLCQMASLKEVQAFEGFLRASNLEDYKLVYETHKCSNTEEELVQCMFTFSQSFNLPKRVHLRALSAETQPSSGNETTHFLFLGISGSTVLILCGCILVIIFFTVIVCVWMKKKKKRAGSQGDQQKLVLKVPRSPRGGSLPELTSPTAQLNAPNQMFPTEPNANLSPHHSLKSVPNLKANENARSSVIPDDPLFTSVDSARSSSEDSSRRSERDAPKALDFNIEFSMVEQESVIRMKNTIKDKKNEY